MLDVSLSWLQVQPELGLRWVKQVLRGPFCNGVEFSGIISNDRCNTSRVELLELSRKSPFGPHDIYIAIPGGILVTFKM